MVHCWAHARRKLKEVFDRDGSEIAAEGLRRIAEFYAVETDIRGIDPGQRLTARKVRTAPLAPAFGEWLQEQRLRVSAKSLSWGRSSPISTVTGTAFRRSSMTAASRSTPTAWRT